MSEWLFDLGNTRLKWAPLAADGQPGAVAAAAHAEGADGWARLPAGEAAWVASVASADATAALLQALGERHPRVHRVRTLPRLGRLRIAYADPQALGVDRFLALLDASEQARPALVVGVGTALTLDLLDADGRHHGGRIAPSPELMRQALHARAAQLPATGGAYVDFAATTADALASGCTGAALALIAQALSDARARLGSEVELRLHGGGGAALRPHLPAHVWVPDAVLRGIAHWRRRLLD
ncbi:type III pantothenate kinase [Thermomonas flagellata]|uniref:type III pantothenate kinase n=1 Tax=Thermomonas flagellata TaxID=2888524 RepID=UPI001F035F9F|nr:type III pantothenate kinase [Thermomonas flagellata]